MELKTLPAGTRPRAARHPIAPELTMRLSGELALAEKALEFERKLELFRARHQLQMDTAALQGAAAPSPWLCVR